MVKRRLKALRFSLLSLLLQASYLHPAVKETPDKVFSDYLTYWQSGEYSKMYDMLSRGSRLMMSRWEFIRAYEKMEALFRIIDFSVYDSDINGDRAEVRYSITTKALFEDQTTRDGIAHLSRENGLWRIEAKEFQSGESID